MNVLYSFHKNLAAVSVAVLLWLCGPSVALEPGFPVATQADGPLQISIRLDQPNRHAADDPRFTVELRNTSKDDLILRFGMMLANGEKQFLDVELELMDAHGRTFQMIDMRWPFEIAGRVDPLILPLCAGCKFSFPVELHNYDYRAVRGASVLKPGTYFLQAKFVGKDVSREETNLDIALMPYWIGSVTSDPLRFEISKAIGSRPANGS